MKRLHKQDWILRQLAAIRAARIGIMFLGVLLLSAHFPAHAQQTSATLVGTITDANGAVVSNAQVKVVSRATGAAREGATDADGNYSFPFLPAGDYELTITVQGYKTKKIDNLTLQVSQTLRQDFAMEIGAVSETINVTAVGVQLQTENSTVGTVIDAAKIVELPLNGRNFVQLAQLIPGVQAGTPGRSPCGAGAVPSGRRTRRTVRPRCPPTARETRPTDSSLTASRRWITTPMTYSFSPSVDSLAEFKVETSTYSAESGGAPGGQVNMVTKRGGNQYHGTVWEFNRNDALTQSYDAIGKKDATPPRLNRNQFGANFGGPVKLPRFGEGGPPLYDGKDKTFFFFNWEARPTGARRLPGLRIVPPAEMRNGDFSGSWTETAADRAARPAQRRDRQQHHPAERAQPADSDLPQFVPLPNTSDGTNNFINTPISAVSQTRQLHGANRSQLLD